MGINRKYEFSWDLIGDIQLGRPNLGDTTSLEIYRLMQFTFRDIIEKKFGTEMTDEIFYESGYLGGKELYKQFFVGITDMNEFVKQLQAKLKELGIAILRMEKIDLQNGEIILTASEDLDCSGLPELDYEVCTYDEGMYAGLLESFTGKKFIVKEVDCWCTGDRTCRFVANVVG